LSISSIIIIILKCTNVHIVTIETV